MIVWIFGLADVLGVDDSRWQYAMTRGEPVKGGEVRVVVCAADVVRDERTRDLVREEMSDA